MATRERGARARAAAAGVHHRRGLLRHRRGQGAARARHRLRLLREVRPRRRQLGVRQQERHVRRLPRPVHQHLAPADGVLGLPDARVLPGLPPPHSDRGLLRRPTSTTSASARRSPSRRASSTPRATTDGAWTVELDTGETRALRRAARGQRSPLEPALARTGVPRRGHVRGRAAARPLLRRQLDLRGQARGRAGDGQLRDGHRRGVLLRRREHLPGGAPGRLDHPQVHLRQTGRPAAQRPARAVQDPPALHPAADQELRRPARALRPAQAQPPLRRGAPDGLRAHPRSHPARHDHAEAEHRLARGLASALRRRQRGGGGRGRVLHRLQDHLPVLRRGLHLRARQPHRAVPARLPPRHRQRVLHRPAAAARRDHAAGRGAGSVGRRLPAGRLRAARRRRRCAPTSPPTRRRCASATWPPSATRSRSTSTTTSTRSPRSAARAPSGRARTAIAHRRDADLLPPQPLPRALPDLQQDAAGQRAGARRRGRRGERAARRARGARRAARRSGAARGDGVRVRREGRAEDDGYRSRARARPARLGRRARLAEEIAFSSGRLLALAGRPAGPLRRGARARRRRTSSGPPGSAS